MLYSLTNVSAGSGECCFVRSVGVRFGLARLASALVASAYPNMGVCVLLVDSGLGLRE